MRHSPIFHGKQYSLRDAYVLDIINYVIEKDLYEIPIDDFKNIGSTSSAQGNHNKLCYKPWNLLEKKKGVRIVTQTLHDFYNNKTKLPLEILVFNNQEAIPNLNTHQISFSELNNLE